MALAGAGSRKRKAARKAARSKGRASLPSRGSAISQAKQKAFRAVKEQLDTALQHAKAGDCATAETLIVRAGRKVAHLSDAERIAVDRSIDAAYSVMMRKCRL